MTAEGLRRPSSSQLRCPKCSYDLTGLPDFICPECGAPFDPIELERRDSRWQRRMNWAAAVLLPIAYYVPYSWLLFIDYGWTDYRWHWIKMWPVLPLLLPSVIIARQALGLEIDGPAGMIIMTSLSLALLVALILIARRGWRALIITAAIVLAVSLMNAWSCYHAFLI